MALVPFTNTRDNFRTSELDQKFLQHVNEYPVRMLTAFQRAILEDFDVNVNVAEMSFVLKHADDEFRIGYMMRTWNDFCELVQLENQLDYLKAVRDELNRRAQAKQTALAKLTAEDRKILGV